MRKCALLMLLPFLIAAEKPWPQKGDTIYVSATLTSFVASTEIKGEASPCVPLTIIKVRPVDRLIVLRDPSGGREGIRGDWSERLHRTEKECSAFLSERGEPKIVRSGAIHSLP